MAGLMHKKLLIGLAPVLIAIAVTLIIQVSGLGFNLSMDTDSVSHHGSGGCNNPKP